MKPEDFLRSASARVEAARVVGNALNPLPWLTGIVSPLSLVLAVWTSDVFFREALFGLAALPVLVTIVAYCSRRSTGFDNAPSRCFIGGAPMREPWTRRER